MRSSCFGRYVGVRDGVASPGSKRSTIIVKEQYLIKKIIQINTSSRRTTLNTLVDYQYTLASRRILNRFIQFGRIQQFEDGTLILRCDLYGMRKGFVSDTDLS